MVGWGLGGDLFVYNKAVYCPDPASVKLVEFLLLVSVRSCFVLVYVRGIIPLARCFNTLHQDLIFLICCDCCNFPCSVLLRCFGSFPILSHFCPLPKAEQNPSFLWRFLPLPPYLFLPPPTQFKQRGDQSCVLSCAFTLWGMLNLHWQKFSIWDPFQDWLLLL